MKSGICSLKRLLGTLFPAGSKTNSPSAQTEVNALEQGEGTGIDNYICAQGIRLRQESVTKEEAICAAGRLLCELGYVEASYAKAMLEREHLTSTYMGMGVAIPHGTSGAKNTVKKNGIVLLQYPEGVDFGGEKAQLVFGIAGIGDEHLMLMGRIGEVLEDDENLCRLKTTSDADWVLELFR